MCFSVTYCICLFVLVPKAQSPIFSDLLAFGAGERLKRRPRRLEILPSDDQKPFFLEQGQSGPFA